MATSFTPRRIVAALAACGLIAAASLLPSRTDAGRGGAPDFDELLAAAGSLCGPAGGRRPALLQGLLLAKSETAPFQPAPMAAAGGDVPLYHGLGTLGLRIHARRPQVQAYFDQGLRLSFGFNHAEAQRSFQAAQRLDPDCAMCHWGEALVLGPNINVPMMPEANAPALAALARAVALKDRATAKERALIEALEQRYAADAGTDRGPLDTAYADAMKAVAAHYPADDTVQALYAEAAMDTQPWDYWEAGGARSKGRGADIVATLEKVLARNPSHAGTIHLYIHAVEASTAPERALPGARRLAALMPGAGHVVHMPAHIYYRVGLYRDSLQTNLRAIGVDERYFSISPSDPLYRSAYYPHNIHFAMVSALMGGDGRTATQAARKLDAAMPVEVVKQFAILEPIKAASYTTLAHFGDFDAVLALPPPAPGLVVVEAMYRYARAVAFAGRRQPADALAEIDALRRIEESADFKPYDAWQVPAKAVVQTARLVAGGRLADAEGDLAAAAAAYESAIAIEDSLAYMEPPYWYYPVRQSLGAVYLRQGRLDEAEQALRASLARVRNNAWALAGLAEVYRRKGDLTAERSARQAYSRAWFGPEAGPDVARL